MKNFVKLSEVKYGDMKNLKGGLLTDRRIIAEYGIIIINYPDYGVEYPDYGISYPDYGVKPPTVD